MVITPVSKLRTITDWRFLEELNSKTYNNRNYKIWFPFLTVMLLSSSMPRNSTPQNLAKFKKASSSGLLALYSRVPSGYRSVNTVWQVASSRRLSKMSFDSGESGFLFRVSKNYLSLKSTLVTWGNADNSDWFKVSSSPQLLPWTINYLNFIILLVSVPVLSLKIYSTCPSS